MIDLTNITNSQIAYIIDEYCHVQKYRDLLKRRYIDGIVYEVTRIINEYRAQGEEIPAEMQAIYDYIHRKHIDRATGIKIIMESYKA